MTDDLLSKWSNPERRGEPLEQGEAEAMMAAIEMPSIMIVPTFTDEVEGAAGCWIGGAPSLPSHIEWPMVATDQLDSDDEDIYRPLHFLAQIDLRQLPLAPYMPSLPSKGTLFFFADYLDSMEGGPGFVANPNYRVVYVDEDVAGTAPRQRPATHPDYDAESMTYWADQNPIEAFGKWPITFAPFVDLDVNRFQNDEFWTLAIRRRADLFLSLRKTLDEETRPPKGFWGRQMPPGQKRGDRLPVHRMFGPNSPENSTAPSDDDVVQLLFFSEDKNINFQYTAGISFCITKADLDARNFENTWAATHSD